MELYYFSAFAKKAISRIGRGGGHVHSRSLNPSKVSPSVRRHAPLHGQHLAQELLPARGRQGAHRTLMQGETSRTWRYGVRSSGIGRDRIDRGG